MRAIRPTLLRVMASSIGFVTANALALSQQPLMRLVEADRALDQGTVRYLVHRRSFIVPPSVPEAAKDPGSSRPSGVSPKAQANVPETQVSRLTIRYRPGGRYEHTITPLAGSLAAFATVSDGTTTASIQRASNFVILSGSVSGAATPVARMIGPYAGANMALGRGVSYLNRLHIQETPSGLQVAGVETDSGTFFRGILNPRYELMATRLERRTKDGRLVARWKIEGAKRSADGKWIPSRATYVILDGNGKLAMETVYKIETADFRNPGPDCGTIPIIPGWQVSDGRSGPNVTYIVPQGVTTLAQLSSAADDAKRGRESDIARRAARESRERQKTALRWGLAAATLVAVGFAARLVRRR